LTLERLRRYLYVSMSSTHDLVGMPLPALQALVEAHGGTRNQAALLMRGLHTARPGRVADVPVVSRRLLARLDPVSAIGRLSVHEIQVSDGWRGTRKLLLRTHDDLPVEAVLFPTHRDPSRLTLCLSSQAGCRMACAFCATGAMGFFRHLTASEIVAQVWEAFALVQPGESLNNIVFMGMGEPLENFDPLRDAIEVIHDDRAFKLAYDKITVSTCGVLPGMERLARELPRVSLALSLHATRDPVRDKLVPLNKKWPIAPLIDFLRAYPAPGSRVFCVEYCLIAGENDSVDEATELGTLLRGIRAKVHLIPYNPVPGLSFARPSPEAIGAFARAADAAGASVAVRDSRGQDILAACGQLGSALIGARRKLQSCS
jgi:23S rRNA (adenine2503-C2)-methyltransferase